MHAHLRSLLKMSFLCLTLSALALTACRDLNGDEKDTPFLTGQDDNCLPAGRCLVTPYVIDQANLICEKVNGCLGLAMSNPKATCMNLLPVQHGLDQFITTSAKNYNQLNNLYVHKKVNVDGRNWEQCLAAIDQLTCDNNIFTSAFNVNEPHNFSQIHQILAASPACASIYTQKN